MPASLQAGFQLARIPHDVDERRSQVVAYNVGKTLDLFIGTLQIACSLSDAIFETGVEFLEFIAGGHKLARIPDDGRDGTQGCEQNEGCPLKARTAAQHRRVDPLLLDAFAQLLIDALERLSDRDADVIHQVLAAIAFDDFQSFGRFARFERANGLR